MPRIHLSPPDVGVAERDLLLAAFDSNWIAPAGPELAAFEKAFADVVAMPHAVALSSGTAALHLALIVSGIGPGDRVLVPTLTFAATANAVTYVGAEPVFVDVDPATWTIDPALVAEQLATDAPPALITVDLYGQCADYDALVPVCREHGTVVIEDAAEALGATYRDRPAGSLGDMAAFSFNGNKIITTSGGGMFVSRDREQAELVRHLSTQARDPFRHYEHSAIGYNYRLSNLLAAVGRAQLQTLGDKVARRRAIKDRYVAALGGCPGVAFMPDADYGTPTNWLTAATIDPEAAGVDRDAVIAALEAADIEARPAWKPMHRQPVFAGAATIGGDVADRISRDGICLPSGSSLSDADQDRIIAIALEVLDRR